MNNRFRTFLFLLKPTIFCGFKRHMKVAITALNLEKLKLQNVLI